MTADPKQGKPVKDAGARARKLAQDPRCRACGDRATDCHHIVYGGGRGRADVVENLMPMCHDHHMSFHQQGFSLTLTREEATYVYTRLGWTPGQAYMERRRYTYEGD